MCPVLRLSHRGGRGQQRRAFASRSLDHKACLQAADGLYLRVPCKCRLSQRSCFMQINRWCSRKLCVQSNVCVQVRFNCSIKFIFAFLLNSAFLARAAWPFVIGYFLKSSVLCLPNTPEMATGNRSNVATLFVTRQTDDDNRKRSIYRVKREECKELQKMSARAFSKRPVLAECVEKGLRNETLLVTLPTCPVNVMRQRT